MLLLQEKLAMAENTKLENCTDQSRLNEEYDFDIKNNEVRFRPTMM